MVKPHPKVSYYGFFLNNDNDSHDPFTLPGLSEDNYGIKFHKGIHHSGKNAFYSARF
jgi:hypothetical protein